MNKGILFAEALLLTIASTGWADAKPASYHTASNVMVELTFESVESHEDPFHTIHLDVLFTGPHGKELRVPAFWASGNIWKARYASPALGMHRYRSECSADSDRGLHSVEGTIEVIAYEGDNMLYLHGPLRIASNGRHFEHQDGTPFLWMGDTWWMGLSKRLKWNQFETLAANRKAKGFNVVQIVAGLHPDMPPFDPRGAGEAGYPWRKDYSRINPDYFDAADKRLFSLVERGFVPCVVGAWGFHLKWMTPEQMQQHWRYLIARYGALPVAWCVAGEANLPWYLDWPKGVPYEDREQAAAWIPLVRYVQETDPFGSPVSIHPTGLGRLSARGVVGDENASLLDFDMLQTGHGQRQVLGPSIGALRDSTMSWPIMPVLNSEVVYEGLLGMNDAGVQRLLFWTSMLSGAAGHTYGGNGIWQINQESEPYGASPGGHNWGNTPWNEAMNLPGGTQVAWGSRFLRNYPWHRFVSHPEWARWRHGPNVEPTWSTPSPIPGDDQYLRPYVAGIADQVRIIYLPIRKPMVLRYLKSGQSWNAKWVNPITGSETPIGQIMSDTSGEWAPPPPPAGSPDWLLVVEKTPHLASQPISVHPDNGKYFLFRGRPRILITATEHYGAIVNRAFDFDKYLEDAAAKRQTLTRTFLLFREQQSARNAYSPIKPESVHYVSPWPRAGPGNACDGEPKYDLNQWNPEYFDRLHRFLNKASDLGIIVELTLFSNTYGDSVWALNPLKAENNIQGIGAGSWHDYNSRKDSRLLARQMAYARKIVEETSIYDNVYFDICNEPGGGFPDHASPTDIDTWQNTIIEVVRGELHRRGRHHLIFGNQAFSYTPKFHQELDASFKSMSFDAINMHPLPDTILSGRAYQLGNFMSKELQLAEFAAFNKATQQFVKPAVHDEDNVASIYTNEEGWTIHRKRAWTAILGQTHYDFIDFSITPGNETGTPNSNRKIRTWMKTLSEFIHSFDFIHAKPSHDWLIVHAGHVVSTALAKPAQDYIAYLADGRQVPDPNVGLPIEGHLTLHLPEGEYLVRFFSPKGGEYSPGVKIIGGDSVNLEVGPFMHDIALRVTRIR